MCNHPNTHLKLEFFRVLAHCELGTQIEFTRRYRRAAFRHLVLISISIEIIGHKTSLILLNRKIPVKAMLTRISVNIVVGTHLESERTFVICSEVYLYIYDLSSSIGKRKKRH